MKALTVTATLENMEQVIAFIDAQLSLLGCSRKAKAQIDVAIDELFGNISRYAYDPHTGSATVEIEGEGDTPYVQITFRDRGIPYNPLERPDPDITLSAGERTPGGLGIYLVKKSMDEIHYEYRNGENILRVRKRIQEKT